MMDLAADLPVTLVVKAANQRVADQTVECVLGWTIRKLKQHLESVYPSKPKHHQQKLIYSGQLLADHLTLKEVLRQIDNNSQHTVHLVCSPSVDSLSQPGPSQSHSSTEKKSEPHTSPSQSSIPSPSETDGLRHRGAQVPSPSSSHSEMTNAGGIQAATAPAAGGMAGMAALGAMGGVPMMGAGVPPMGMPGYPYTPEQIAWMQQMYSQYMAQYMQYYGYQVPAVAQPVNPIQAPPPQPAANPANPAPANNAPPNQNMRMNAQGGMEEDDEEEQRDWLDYIYVCFRFLVLASIVYFYSSASRFLAVALGFFAVYLIQHRFWMRNRQPQEQRQQQQEEAQQPPAQAQQEQQQQQQADQQARPEQADRNEAEGQQAEGQDGAGTEDGSEESTDHDDEQEGAEPQEEIPSNTTLFVRTFLSFFTSLIPARPPAVNGN